MRYSKVITAALFLAIAAGCGARETDIVPAVEGQRLDLAQAELDDAGLGYEVTGGGAFGVVVKSHWRVCEQHPAPGLHARSVELVVARSCPRSSASGLVPDVTGLRLDVAEEELGERGLDYYVYPEDEVIIRSNWTVCSQYPDPGELAGVVELYVDHFSCDEDD
jgi:beta-lactam-binding protein with PASTA domain